MGEHPISRHSIDERSKPIVGRQDNTQTHREMTQSSPFFICRQINLHQPQQMIHSQGRRKQQKQPTQNQEPQQQTNHMNTPKKNKEEPQTAPEEKRQTRHDQLPKPTTPTTRKPTEPHPQTANATKEKTSKQQKPRQEDSHKTRENKQQKDRHPADKATNDHQEEHRNKQQKQTHPQPENQQNHTPKQQKTKFTDLLHPPGGLRAGSPRFQWFEWNIPNGFCLYKRLIFLVQDFASMPEMPDRHGRSVDRG